MISNIKDEFLFMPKSSIKAGDGKESGLYPFFTSSDTKQLFLDDYIYDDELVVIGTGGKPSCNYYNGKFSCSTDNFVLKSKGNVKARYLYYFLRKNNLSILQQGFHGAGLQHIGKEYVQKIEINIESCDKQNKIIATLDNTSKLIIIKQKELQQLDELIKSRFIEMFGDRLINLNKKMSSIATPVIGLTYKPSNVTKDGTIVLRSGNIQNNELQLEEDIVRVSNINISEQKWIKDKDILMCSRNGSAHLVGKSCLIRHPEEQMSFGAFMTVVRTKYPYFLQGFFTSDYFKNQLTGVGTASVNQITSGMLNNYDVIEPTEVEEKEFESYVKQIDKSKFLVQKEIDLLNELLDKKMDEYFGGD